MRKITKNWKGRLFSWQRTVMGKIYPLKKKGGKSLERVLGKVWGEVIEEF